MSFAIVVALNVNNPQDMKLSAYQCVMVYIIRVSIDASYICIYTGKTYVLPATPREHSLGS